MAGFPVGSLHNYQTFLSLKKSILSLPAPGSSTKKATPNPTPAPRTDRAPTHAGTPCHVWGHGMGPESESHCALAVEGRPFPWLGSVPPAHSHPPARVGLGVTRGPRAGRGQPPAAAHGRAGRRGRADPSPPTLTPGFGGHPDTGAQHRGRAL